VLAVKFKEKPEDSVREAVKAAGFQWKHEEQAWTQPYGQRARIAAESLDKTLQDLIPVPQGRAL